MGVMSGLHAWGVMSWCGVRSWGVAWGVFAYRQACISLSLAMT